MSASAAPAAVLGTCPCAGPLVVLVLVVLVVPVMLVMVVLQSKRVMLVVVLQRCAAWALSQKSSSACPRSRGCPCCVAARLLRVPCAREGGCSPRARRRLLRLLRGCDCVAAQEELLHLPLCRAAHAWLHMRGCLCVAAHAWLPLRGCPCVAAHAWLPMRGCCLLRLLRQLRRCEVVEERVCRPCVGPRSSRTLC